LDLREQASRSPDADVRYAGELLSTAVGDYLQVVREQFLHVDGPMESIASAYAKDHGYEVAHAR
jgi:hypothetical protein